MKEGPKRLDSELAWRGLVESRSQAEQEIEFGNVAVNGRIVTKTAYPVTERDKIRLIKKNPYVSRAGLKLASVGKALKLDFRGKVVLDVGSSTGGFTDFALQNGAKKVIAVDVGTNQLHPRLRADERVELYEQTDIRDFSPETLADIAVVDVSFISLRLILPVLPKLLQKSGLVVAMCKPQFEAAAGEISKGVVKNSAMRRAILKDFEGWLVEQGFVIIEKNDSAVTGEKGNLERFYLLKKP